MSKVDELREEMAEYWADWLLDAVAVATQDRRLLRGEEAYDALLGEAILRSGHKAILNASKKLIEAARQEGVRPKYHDLCVGRLLQGIRGREMKAFGCLGGKDFIECGVCVALGEVLTQHKAARQARQEEREKTLRWVAAQFLQTPCPAHGEGSSIVCATCVSVRRNKNWADYFTRAIMGTPPTEPAKVCEPENITCFRCGFVTSPPLGPCEEHSPFPWDKAP